MALIECSICLHLSVSCLYITTILRRRFFKSMYQKSITGTLFVMIRRAMVFESASYIAMRFIAFSGAFRLLRYFPLIAFESTYGTRIYEYVDLIAPFDIL